MSGSDSKKVVDMTERELEKYRHTPETELSVLVCQAAERKEYAVLKDYLQLVSETDPKKIDQKDSAGMTALHCAVASESLPAVILLVKYGSYVNAQDLLGFTPLFLATGRYPSTDIASHLIQKGHAVVDAKTKTGATPLHGAALQGNIDCVKLLLKHGADPRIEDNERTTAFDLAKDKNIRTLLHDAIIDMDAKKEAADVVCSNCKKTPTEGALKRCAQCHITLYCSRDCQIQHWKRGGHKASCAGYVLAKPLRKDGKEVFQTSFYQVAGSDNRKVKIFNRQPGESASRMEFLRNKRFIVKVQLPLGSNNNQCEMMVYNADRTCEGFIYPLEKGYSPLADRIRREGFMGIKAFFWAELCEGTDGQFKVFHGKTAPFQKW